MEIFNSFWIFGLALLQSSFESQAVDWDIRLIYIAWLSFVLVIVTAYTANLTVFLVQKNSGIPIDSIKEVVQYYNREIQLQTLTELFCLYFTSMLFMQ